LVCPPRLDRARSATEAFLFRRLETLTQTKGRFRLNERLPIAFDVSGALEVDLLCADARVAVELRDGVGTAVDLSILEGLCDRCFCAAA
jgi:hypothetical protein